MAASDRQGRRWERRYDWRYPDAIDPWGKQKQTCPHCEGERSFSLKYGKCFNCQRGWFQARQLQDKQTPETNQALLAIAARVVADEQPELARIIEQTDGRLSIDWLANVLGCRWATAREVIEIIDGLLPEWASIEWGVRGDKVRKTTRIVFRDVPAKVRRSALRRVKRLYGALAGRYRVNQEHLPPSSTRILFHKNACREHILSVIRGGDLLQPRNTVVTPERGTPPKRAQAITLGLPTYQGKACRKGHTERVTIGHDGRVGGECAICPPRIVRFRRIRGRVTRLVGAMGLKPTSELFPLAPTTIRRTKAQRVADKLVLAAA